MSFLDFIRHPKGEQDEAHLVTRRYRYWRFRIFYSMYVGYSVYYFTRQSIIYAAPSFSSALALDKADFGMISSALFLSYGASKFFSGVQADKSNPRYFMAFGLILTGVLNILFGLSSSLFLFTLFAALIGWFQGYGWPPCARLLTHWYSVSERGKWWGIWNTCHNVGASLIPWIVVFSVESFGWRGGLYIPGTLAILCGIFLLNRLRDTPESLGLPPVERYRGQESLADDNYPDEKKFTAKELLIDFVLKNRNIWLLAGAYFFVYILRTAINSWSLFYLNEVKGFTLKEGAFCVTAFEIAGGLGSLAAGWASDHIFKSRRGPINVIFSLMVFFCIVALYLLPYGNLWLASAVMMLSGFFIFGPQMLIGIVAAEISHKKAAGTATGFVGWFAYFGAAGAAYPLSKVIQGFGWSSYFALLIGCAVMALLFLIPLWPVGAANLRSGSRVVKEESAPEPSLATESAPTAQ